MKKNLLFLFAVLALAITTTQVKAIDNTGLIVHISANSSVTNSTVANDSTGNGNQGNLTGGLVYDSTNQWFNTTAASRYLEIGTSPTLQALATSRNVTFSMWVRMSNTDQYNAFPDLFFFRNSSGGRAILVYWSNASQVVGHDIRNSSGTTSSGNLISGGDVSLFNASEWAFVAFKVDACQTNRITAYLNGQKKTSQVNTVANCTAMWDMNGTLRIGNNNKMGYREIRVYNRTLDDVEVDELYELGPYGNITEQQVSIVVNASKTPGNIRPDLFGYNLQTWGLNYSKIDSNDDGNLDTYSNYQWHRSKAKNSSAYSFRSDMSLNSKYLRMPNTDFETWYMTNSSVNTGATLYYNVPYSWALESSSGNGTIVQSATAYGGTYSVNLTNTGNSGTVFLRKNMQVNKGYGYVFSVVVKSNNVTTIKAEDMDNGYAQLCANNSAGSGNWENLSCYFNSTSDPSSGIRFLVRLDSGESALIDNANLTTRKGIGGTLAEYSEWRYNLTPELDRVEWAYNNSVKILYIIDYGIEYFANGSSPDCYTTSATNDRCNALDATGYGNAVVDFINRTTRNGTYLSAMDLQFWNEPDGSNSWLPNRSSTTAASYKLIQQFNTTRNTIKAVHPTAVVGGLSVSSISSVAGQEFTNAFIGNLSPSGYDFIAFHKYTNNATYIGEYDALTDIFSRMDSYCTGKNCSDVRVTEWNYAAEDVNARNDTILYLGTLLGYMAFLDSNVSRYGGNLFNWQESVACTSTLNQYYPDNYCGVNEPLLGDTQRPTYNATLNFSTYINYNSVLWNYTKNDNEVFGAFTNNSTKIKGIIINGDSVRKNITLQTNGILNPYRIVASNGTTYSYVSNSFNIGLEAYTPLFFELQVSDLSFSSVYPTSDPSVDAGLSQLFNFSLNNIASLPYNATWYLDGSNVTGCYNQSSCTFLTNSSSTGNYNITVQIESSANNPSHTWLLSVNNAQVITCNNFSESFGVGATMMALVFMVVFGGFALVTIYDFNSKTIRFEGEQLTQLVLGGLVTCILFIMSVGIMSVASGGC